MFTIVSYTSAGPIRFGMSQDELKDVIGPPIRMGKNFIGNATWTYRDFDVQLSAVDDIVIQAGFTPQVGVDLDGIDIFRLPSAFEDLIKKDGQPFESNGFIILLRLGITLTGFHDNDPSQKAVTAFARGVWDDSRARFKPYVMGSRPSP